MRVSTYLDTLPSVVRLLSRSAVEATQHSPTEQQQSGLKRIRENDGEGSTLHRATFALTRPN